MLIMLKWKKTPFLKGLYKRDKVVILYVQYLCDVFCTIIFLFFFLRSGSQMSLHEESPDHNNLGRREHKNAPPHLENYPPEPDSVEGKWKMQFGKDNR